MSNEIGRKNDVGKDRWDLLPFVAMTEVVRVLTFGANKYGDNNWRYVKDGKARYVGAFFRHVTASLLGEKKDSESGLSHLAHAACCVLFLLEKELEEQADCKNLDV